MPPRSASPRTSSGALQARVRDPRRRGADVHVGNDRQAQGLPAHPRGDRPPRRQRAADEVPDDLRGPLLGSRCRCSTSAASSRCSAASAFGRDVRPRGPLRPARFAPPAPGRALHGRLPGLRPDLARDPRPSRATPSSTSAGCGSSRASRRPSGCATSSGACRGRLRHLVRRDGVLEQPDPRRRRRRRADRASTRSAPLVPGMELKIVDPETG